MENSPRLRDWYEKLTQQKPLVIAGPCSAETEQQLMDIATNLRKNDKVHIFRAGIWKPRTRPGGFEGVGEIGLKWLQKVKQETGMLVATEVANKQHVLLAQEYGIDVFWIGARTTVNPFAVQEIAEALHGTDKIVLLKNPVNPDLSLWLGGLERLYNAGIKNLGVIHRGFSTYQKTKYRNLPEWQIPIELQARFPDLPLICDPSHITGQREMVADVAQQALNLNYDGLMIETHNCPDEAWSDAKQQITPETLNDILNQLQLRKPEAQSEEYHIELNNLRIQIDELDMKILDILGERMQIAEQIGGLKSKHNVAILQSDRWQDVLQKYIREGSRKGLTSNFMTTLFKAIHQESIEHQEKKV